MFLCLGWQNPDLDCVQPRAPLVAFDTIAIVLDDRTTEAAAGFSVANIDHMG